MGASTGKDQESYQTYHPASSFRQNVMRDQPPTIFPCFAFRPQVVIAEDGIAVRDERKRQSRRIGKLGKGRAGLLEKPVRLYVGYSHCM